MSETNYEHIDKIQKGLSHIENYKSTLAMKASQAKMYAAKKTWGADGGLEDVNKLVNTKDFKSRPFRSEFAGHMADFYVLDSLEHVKTLNPSGKKMSEKEKLDALKKLKKEDIHFYHTLTKHYGILAKDELEGVMERQGESFWTNYEAAVANQLAERVTNSIQGTLTEKLTDNDLEHIKSRMNLKEHADYMTRDLTRDELIKAFTNYSVNDGKLTQDFLESEFASWYDPKHPEQVKKGKAKVVKMPAPFKKAA